MLLGCNTATAVAARRLQRNWLPGSHWRAEGATSSASSRRRWKPRPQTPWAVTTPQYPQKYLTDRIAVFGTTRTIASNVYAEEIRKRCPRVTVVQQVCSELAGAIEHEAPEAEIDRLVREGIQGAMDQAGGLPPHRAILGCTHFPLVEHLFRQYLPPATRILSQPEVVADSLEDYLVRRPRSTGEGNSGSRFADDGRAGDRQCPRPCLLAQRIVIPARRRFCLLDHDPPDPISPSVNHRSHARPRAVRS